MPYLLPHSIYSRFLPPYDALRLLFRDMLELYAERGIGVKPLESSATAYDAWLLGLRRSFRRKRSLPADWLEERFEEARADGELGKVIHNERLARFLASILGKEARFDYLSLKLEPI